MFEPRFYRFKAGSTGPSTESADSGARPRRTTAARSWSHPACRPLRASGGLASPPRLARHTLRVRVRDQQLTQHMKIPTQDPQPHIPAVPAEGPIPAPSLPVPRLQRTDRRLDPWMPPPGLTEFHRGLALLPLGLDVTRLGQARLRDQLGQFVLILGRMKAAIERRTADPPAQPSLHLFHLSRQHLAVLGPAGQDRVVTHKAGAVLDDQDSVAELDRLGDLATLDQLRLRLEHAEELLVVGDLLLREHTASRLFAGSERHIQEVNQLRPEPLDRGCHKAGTDGDQGGIERLRRP